MSLGDRESDGEDSDEEPNAIGGCTFFGNIETL